MLGTYHLSALFDILNKIHFVYEPEKLWQFILEHACKTVQAESGSYFEVIENESHLRISAAYGIEMKSLNRAPFKVGVGVCGWVAQYHQPALVADVRTDNRFNRQVDSITGFQTKSILCIPVFSQKRTYGVIEVLNRKTGPFSPQDQEFMTLLGRQAAVAYQNLLLLEEVSRTKILFESLVGNLSGGLIAMDRSEKVTVMNPSALHLLGLSEQGQYVGKPVNVILMDAPALLEILQKTLTSAQTVSRQEMILSVKGQDLRVGYTTILISDPDRNVLGSGVIFQKLS